jgi:hypothetical protein
MSFEVQGIFGFLILIADIWAIVSTLSSNRTTGAKVLWILLIFFLPVLGWLIWLIMGPRGQKA